MKIYSMEWKIIRSIGISLIYRKVIGNVKIVEISQKVVKIGQKWTKWGSEFFRLFVRNLHV